MKLNTKQLAVMTIFAALYAAGVVYWPASFTVAQVRVADALLPFAMIFGLPSAFGLSIGCLVSNVFGGLGVIDIVGGATANLIACVSAWYIGRNGGRIRRFAGTVVQTVVISLIVGPYLSVLLNVPIIASVFGIFIGEIIAINIIGFPLQEIIRRSKVFQQFTN